MARLQACVRCGTPYKHGKRCPNCTRTRRRAYDQWERNQDAKAFYNSAQWKRMRKAVGERDHYVCQSCRKAAGKSGHCDHIIPREDGGSDEADNLQWLCHGCHSAKTMRETFGA